MPHYAIAFDLDTRAMRDAGFTDSQITRVYQREIPDALRAGGFPAHPQGSLYHTTTEQDAIRLLMVLQGVLRSQAPNFCQYVGRAHIFRMEEWSDVTDLISTSAAPAPLSAETELEHQVFASSSSSSGVPGDD